MKFLSLTDTRGRDEDYSPRDIILAATAKHVSRRIYSPYGTLGVRGPDGGIYAYDHWEVKPIGKDTDKVTVYLVEIGKEPTT